MKTIYYYQSFVGLEKALENITDIDVIIVSSIHFGKGRHKPGSEDPAQVAHHAAYVPPEVLGCARGDCPRARLDIDVDAIQPVA